MSKTKIKIITDSTTSLSKEECEKLGIDCLETSYMLDDVNYSAFENEEETLLDFYKRLDERFWLNNNPRCCNEGLNGGR